MSGWDEAGLPPRVARMVAQADAREAVEAKRAQAEREARNEAVHAEVVEFYRQLAEARGEDITALEVATGRVSGRSLADIFADAQQAGDFEDAVAAARAARETGSGPVPVFAGEPILHEAPRARGAIGQRMFNTYRHWQELRAARQRVDAAEDSLAGDYGFVCDAPPCRPREIELVGPGHGWSAGGEFR